MKKNFRVIIGYVVLVVVLIVVVASQMNDKKVEPVVVPTNEFVSAVKDGRVKTVTYTTSDKSIKGTFWKTKGAKTEGEKPVEFTSTFIGESSINALMQEHPKTTFKIDTKLPSQWISLAGTVLPLLFLGVLLFFLFNQLQGGNKKAMQFGRSNAKLNQPNKNKITFKDVAGANEAVEELDEIKQFLSTPDAFLAMGAKIPHGVLLVGPPGTGKTLLARAVAGEADVPFYSISGSEFMEMFVGVGASRVRDLFKQAKETSPSIIFIDEIDAVGRQRGAGVGGGHDEREQTLNQLLVEMDGFDVNDSVILIAATNRPDVLDPALLRPGRFDRQITVDRPDMEGRKEILVVHAANKPFDEDVDLGMIAKRTPGFTGADLANLLNEAALLAARFKKKVIGVDEITEAIDRVVSGPERKSRIISDKEKRTIAYHEVGHALVGHVLPNSDEIHKISIISRGQALGYTLSIPSEDRFLTSRNEMLDDLAMFLGGRVAEEIAVGDITTGASNDLERATKMARQMVTRFGMSEALGAQVYGEANHEVFLGRDYAATNEYSAETAARIDAEVSHLMGNAHKRAYDILNERKEQLEFITDILIERETLDIEAVTALLNNEWDAYIVTESSKLAAKAQKEQELSESESSPAEVEAEATDVPEVAPDSSAPETSENS